MLKLLEMPIHVQRLSLAPMHCYDQETRIYQHKEKYKFKLAVSRIHVKLVKRNSTKIYSSPWKVERL